GRAEFVAFDIDHPQSRPLFSALLNEVVPKLKGKNMSKLGYMLSNEPHWNTSGTWDIVDFTTYTRAKFATWLEAKHQSIANLNTLWGTSHASFQSASNDSDLQPSRTNKRGVLESLRGTPKWYDFMRFNQVRVNNWFTYLHDEIQGIDAAAKTHIKLIPFQWTDNDRGSGLDFEYLIGLCEVIGHDAHMDGSRRFGNRPWQNKYMFDWLPLTMSHDFFHSIKPNATNYNSETHILYNVRFREAFLRTSYVRASHWLATLHGMDMSLNWVWARQEDGSLSPNFGVATTVGQQPRTLFELHSTILDLNSYANEISELQEIQNPIRIFYSETSAINKDNHMSQLSDLYESLYFEGYRLGFVTENILNTQSLADFNYVVVKDVEFVKESEIDALQNYLNNGGVVFLDTVSLKKDEYGKNHTKTLSAGTGMILPLGSNPKSSILNKLSADGIKSAIEVAEVNEDSNVLKAVAHKSVFTNSGKNIISLVNTGKTNATITLSMTGLPSSGFTIFNLLKGESVTNGFVMKPEEVLLLELRVDGKTELLRINEAPDCLKQNGTGSIKLDYKATEPRDIHVDIQDLSDFKGVGKSKVRVDGEGTIVVNIEARENLRLNENYRLNIYMTEADKDFSATVEEISGGKIVVVEENCIDNILSIDTFEKLEDFKIYPVPFNDKLIISNVESLVTEFKLISLNGKKLIQGKDKGDITIDTQWLSKGVYFVQLLDGNNEIKHIIKVIK
ncbi:T9SS type A sorting domain-containing protein, partial [Aquimarina agarilytica]|uniref:T9SS type A sorting domain-containing protein n=1 Tax=Aquimarina agarilytica TaxID=1087449 RepID=UPI000288C083